MSIHPLNPINVIFGLKLRQARLQKGLSVTELAQRSQLSPSYITEIEKGRKYPKADKVLRLAAALGLEYDQLVSLRLEPPLSFVEAALSSQLLQGFPLELFGLDPGALVELLSRSPGELSALVRALGEVARGYNIREEHLFRAALRCFQELHHNYLPDVEQAADEFRRRANLQGPPVPDGRLEALLEGWFGFRLEAIPVERWPTLAGYRAVYVPSGPPRLLLNPSLMPSQRKFVLAREVGYRVLELSDRSPTNPPDRADSFAQVLNDFKAAYFAGCLLMPRERVLEDLQALFQLPSWQGQRLLELLQVYDVTPETLLYRFSELIPTFFHLRVHFLRFSEVNGAIRLYKHLNMNELSLPSGFHLPEHYCRRWLTVRIIRELARTAQDGPIVGIQRSRFLQSHKEFLCLGFARRDNLPPRLYTSVILGLRVDEELWRRVRFAADGSIPQGLLNETCERCPLPPEECSERAAPPTRWQQEQAIEARRQALRELVSEARRGA